MLGAQRGRLVDLEAEPPYSCEFRMDDELNKPKMRSPFRWLAGLTCPFFFYAAIATAFPQIIGGNGQPNFLLAASLGSVGMLFAGLAATGRLRR